MHATAQLEVLPHHHHLPQHPGQQPILDSGSLITPSTYAYATSTTTARSGGGRIEDTSSSLIHSPSSSSLDWGRIAELSYGLFEPMMMGSSGSSSLSSGYSYYQPPYTLKEVK